MTTTDMPLKGTGNNQNKISNLETCIAKLNFANNERRKSFLVKITAVDIQYIAARENLNQKPKRIKNLYQDNNMPMFTPTEWSNMAIVFVKYILKYIQLLPFSIIYYILIYLH
jgi:hypothetical protein